MSSNYKDELNILLKENYVHDTFMTHVSLIQPKGKYNLNRSVLSRFWNLYCKLVEVGDETLGIAEHPTNYSAIRVDVDLKFRIEEEVKETHLYTDKFVESLISTFQSILKEIVVDIKPEQLYCILLEKPIYKTDIEDQYKNGFHLHFPHLFLSKIDQEIHIFPKVKKYLDESTEIGTYFNEFSTKLWNTDTKIDSIIDSASLKNCWLLYGSRKDTTLDTYTISKIYNENLQLITLEDAFLCSKIYDEDEILIELNERNVKFQLPRILSIVPYGRNTNEIKIPIAEEDRTYLTNYVEKTKYKKPDDDKRTDKEIKQDITTLKQLIKLINPNRAEEHNNWMTIGWAIYYITRGSDEGLELWIKFSEKSLKSSRSESRCIYEWSNMNDKYQVTLGTIKYFAKKDNPEAYAKYIFDMNQKHMRRGKELKTSHYDLALLLHTQFSNEYVFSGSSGWYRFINHHWECIDDGLELRNKISNELVEFFTLMLRELCVEELASYNIVKNGDESDSDDEEKKDDSIEERKKNIRKLIQCLKTSPFKNNIMKECQEIFQIRNFDRKLNSNRYLIGFQNGVYDLENNIFRDGLPSDYISTQMAINYIEFEQTDQKVLDVFNFLEKVFPDQSVRRYFLDVMSESFVGYNHRKQVYFWTGEGDNGKSITQMFFEKIFGKLSIKAPTTLITSKRQQSGSANAELARAGNGVRTLFLEEPDPDEEIYTGVFKHLSGNDSIYTRDLFQRGKDVSEIIPMFKLHVICNKLPRIRKGGDKATWNRIRVIPFEATFTKDAPDTIEEQFRNKKFSVDPNLAQKIPSLVEPFCWILLQHRMQPKGEEPEKVKNATEKYRSANDILFLFCKAIGIIEDSLGKVSASDLYHLYEEWLDENYPKGTSQPSKLNKVEFDEYFVKKWCKEPNCNGFWEGIRIVNKRTGNGGNLPI